MVSFNPLSDVKPRWTVNSRGTPHIRGSCTLRHAQHIQILTAVLCGYFKSLRGHLRTLRWAYQASSALALRRASGASSVLLPGEKKNRRSGQPTNVENDCESILKPAGQSGLKCVHSASSCAKVLNECSGASVAGCGLAPNPFTCIPLTAAGEVYLF